MNSKKAKALRLAVAIEAYAGDDVSVEDVKKGRKDVYAEPLFKSMVRRRKKNEHHHEQVVITKTSARQQRLKKLGKEKKWKLPDSLTGKKKIKNIRSLKRLK